VANRKQTLAEQTAEANAAADLGGDPTPTRLERGACPVCSADVALRKGGLVREHKAPNGKVCPGAGQPAADVPSSGPAAEPSVAPSFADAAAELNRPAGAWAGAEAIAVDPNLVDPDPDNARMELGDLEELGAALIAVGMLEPVIVKPAGPDGRYQLISGERRTAAARLVGMPEIPALVRADLGTPDAVADAAAAQIVENFHRRPLSPLEEASAFRRLQDLGIKQADIAHRVGINQGTVSKRLSLLKLPEPVRAQVAAGDIDVADAVELAKLPKEQATRAAAEVARGGSASNAVARARREAVKAIAATGVEVFDAPGKLWEWPEDDLLPLAGQDEITGRYFRRPLPAFDGHETEPCHAAVLVEQWDGGKKAWGPLYVCTDPSRHGIPTVEELGQAADAERAAADAAEEAERARRAAEESALLQAAAALRTAKVPRVSMSEIVALAALSAPIAGDYVQIGEDDGPPLLASFDVDCGEDDWDAVAADLEALVANEDPLRVAFVGIVDILAAEFAKRYYRGWWRCGQAFLALLADHAGFVAGPELMELAERPAVKEARAVEDDLGAVIPPPAGALGWYLGSPDFLPEDPARWIVDEGELEAIAGGAPERLLTVDEAVARVRAGSDLSDADPGDASPAEDQAEDGGLPAGAVPLDDLDEAAAALAGDVEPSEPDPGTSSPPAPGSDCPGGGQPAAGMKAPQECPVCGASVGVYRGKLRKHQVPAPAEVG
jgi:ParB/RepB/Spo0J family partition protein